MTKPIPAPEQRVRGYMAKVEEVQAAWPEGHYNHPVDEIDHYMTGERLMITDIKDVLKELAWHQERVEELENAIQFAVDQLQQVRGLLAVQKALDAIEPEGDAEQGYEITATND